MIDVPEMQVWSYDDPAQRAAAFNAFLELQDHRCAMCGHREGDVGRRVWPTRKLVERKSGSDILFRYVKDCWPTDPTPVQFGVDHDHDTGLARGVLCTGCNRLVAWCETEECTCLWGYCPTANYLANPPARGGDPALPPGGAWSHAMFICPGDAILNGVGDGIWYANEVVAIKTVSVMFDFYGGPPTVTAEVLPDLTFSSFHTRLTPVIRDAASSRFVASVPQFTQALRDASPEMGTAEDWQPPNLLADLGVTA